MTRPVAAPVRGSLTEAAEVHQCATLLIGEGTLDQVGTRAAGWSDTALVVADAGMRATGWLDEVLNRCHAARLRTILHDTVHPNPTVADVEAGLDLGTGHDVGVIVSVGGGSAHDAAKVIALIAANGGAVPDYVGTDRSRGRGVPVVAVNTTAGSGADVSRFAVIGDGTTGRKLVLADRHLTPRLSINDPRTTATLPAAATAASGLDALTHAVEAYVSTAATPSTDVAALRATELCARYLERAVQGDDQEARAAMMHAAYLAAVAFNTAVVGAVHALSHALGGAYDLAHGLCNGLLLPAVVRANLPAATERYADLARVLGVRRASDAAAAEAGVEAMRALGQRVGLPSGFGALGVQRSRLPELARAAADDLCMQTNPRPFTHPELLALYEESL